MRSIQVVARISSSFLCIAEAFWVNRGLSGVQKEEPEGSKEVKIAYLKSTSKQRSQESNPGSLGLEASAQSLSHPPWM